MGHLAATGPNSLSVTEHPFTYTTVIHKCRSKNWLRVHTWHMCPRPPQLPGCDDVIFICTEHTVYTSSDSYKQLCRRRLALLINDTVRLYYVRDREETMTHAFPTLRRSLLSLMPLFHTFPPTEHESETEPLWYQRERVFFPAL